MSRDIKNLKVRHSSLDMPDVEVVKKKYDILNKACNKLFHFGEQKTRNSEPPGTPTKKYGKQSAIETLCKATQKPIEGVFDNISSHPSKLQKQNSISGYPIQIQVEEYDDCTISRDRPATICVDKIDQNLNTAALALERPRKKLSFREPETVFHTYKNLKSGVRYQKADTNTLKLPAGGMKRSTSFTNGIIRTPSEDNFNLEKQAMRVVRTVGQAFEVCHKLSITDPEHDHLDQEDQETVSAELLSDRLSDITSDKSKKDFQYETDMEKMYQPSCDDINLKHPHENKSTRSVMPKQLDLLPPPPTSDDKSLSMISAETYSSPHSDMLVTESNATSSSLPPPGSALSAHHEIQLLREQLEQQNQQTQAAVAQLQLAREQLASEQAARIEAQTRTHQLLVHNRELLDHIAALVSHLQNGSENSGGVGNQQQNSPQLTLPQHQPSVVPESYLSDLPETTLDRGLHQSLRLNPQGLIENRVVTSCMPPSPLKPFNPTGSMFNYPYSQEATYDSELLRLQALSGYIPPSPYPFNYNPTPPYVQSPYFPQPNILNNNYTLPHSSKKFSAIPSSRHSFAENPMLETRHNSEPRQISHQYHSNSNLHYAKPPNSFNLQNYSHSLQNNLKERQQIPHPQLSQENSTVTTQNTRNSPLRGATPRPSSLIKPLSQMGTLTTTDADGKVRVIVPASSNTNNSIKDNESLLSNLKLTDDFQMNGPPIQRSTSEKVPNRSELMSQVQRSMWARHTTK